MGKIVKTVAVAVGAAALIATGAGAVFGAAAVTAALGGISAMTLTAAASALSIGASLLAKPKATALNSASTDRLNLSINPQASRVMVFGRTAMGTDLMDQEITGADKEYVHRFVVCAAHRVNAIQEIWFDDELAWTSAAGVQGRFVGYLLVDPKLEGSPANVVNLGPRMGATRRYTGCAYVYLRFRLTGIAKKTESPFAAQVPTRVTIIGEGIPCYDPRQDSTRGGSGAMRANDQTTWTYGPHARNLACQLATRLLGWRIQNPQSGTWKLSVGMGVPPARIDWASFIEGANLCDEPVTLAAGGTEPRYRGDGVWTEADAPTEVVDGFKAAMNADLDDQDGLFRLTVFHNDLAMPVAHFTEADLQGDFVWQQTASLNDSFNVVRGSWIDPSERSLYQPAPLPEVRVPSPDGLDREHTASLGLVQSRSQGVRLLKQRLQRQLYSGTFRGTFLATGWRVQKNSVITFSFAPEGFTSKLFRVLETEVRQDGLVPMVLREEHPAIYAWDAEEGAAVSLAEPTLYAAGDAPIPQMLGTVAEGATRNDDGLNMLPNSGDPATWTFANGAYAALQNTGYAGMPNGWYASLLSNNALVRFSDYVPVAGGETLYFSYTVASDHPVGAPVGQSVNASYSYKRADGSSAAVNLGGSPYNSSRDIAQMGSGIVVTVKFTVPLDAVSIQPYVERPVFTSYTVFVRAGAYLGRGEPGATANVVTYSAVAPSAPREGDLWVDTSGTYAVFKLRSGGTWVTGANALSVYNALSGRPIALADINTTESSKLTGIADKATRNDDGPNMLPTAGDQATWSFGGGAVPVNVTTGYAGMTNDWYAQLQSSGASVRFSDYIPCSPGETLYFSYIVASDYPVGAPSGQTVNASYAYMRPDGSTSAVNLSSVSARDLAQMGGGTLVTAKFTVPIDAIKVQPYVERPTFAGYTAYVRRNAYLGRSAPGATNNSATINDDGSIKDGKVGTGALLASAVTTKSSAFTGGGILITPGGYVFVTVQQLTLTSTGEPVHLIFSHAYYAIDNAKVKVQVWREGTLLLTLNERNVSGGDNGGECMVFTDTPGAGTFTYYVKVGSNDNGDTTVYNRSIFALELKR